MKKIAQIFKWHNSDNFYIKPVSITRDLYRFDGSLIELLMLLNDFEQSNKTSFDKFHLDCPNLIKAYFVLDDTKKSKFFELLADYTNEQKD